MKTTLPRKGAPAQSRRSSGLYGVTCRVNRLTGVFPLHRHEYIEVEYVAHGALEQEINGRKITAQAGDFWCLSQQDMHALLPASPAVIHHICIDGKAAPDAVRRFLNSVALPVAGRLNECALSSVDEWFGQLAEASVQTDRYAKERTAAYLLLILTRLLENGGALGGGAAAGYAHIARAVAYIEQNYMKPLTVAQAARAVYLSPNYFSLLFRRVSGYTFLDYLTHIRVQKAQELLLYTDLPITYIAFDCGFGSFSTFSRAFRKRCGCTPSDYRAEQIGKN